MHTFQQVKWLLNTLLFITGEDSCPCVLMSNERHFHSCLSVWSPSLTYCIFRLLKVRLTFEVLMTYNKPLLKNICIKQATGGREVKALSTSKRESGPCRIRPYGVNSSEKKITKNLLLLALKPVRFSSKSPTDFKASRLE